MGALGKLDVRVGFVSSIDYEKGMVEVTYPDMDDEVTQPLPLLTPFADEYFMPRVDDQIIVLHLSNGAEFGVVLGWEWDEEHPPHEYGEEFYRKDFSHEGDARLCYNKGKNKVMVLTLPKKLVIHAPESIVLDTPLVRCTGKVVAAGEVIAADSVCLVHHTHPTSDGATALIPNPTCAFSGDSGEEC